MKILKIFLELGNNLHLRKGFNRVELKKARLNLKRFLRDDYRCIDKLNRDFQFKKKISL